ncbi:MAG: hypothetical protein G3H99_06035 [Ferrovum sp.]|nr:hypothetical protein [Ferrovum sp.]NDU86594.1 hypothetical protein [Ferrovum sp.]
MKWLGRVVWWVGLAGGMVTPVVQAFGMLVYDPINHIETALTAANAVQQTAQQVQSYLVLLQQLASQLQNLRSLPQAVLTQVLQPYTQQIAVVQNLSQVLSGTMQQLSGLHQDLLSQAQQMASLQLTPQDYLNREIQLSQSQGGGLDAALQSEVTTLQSLQGSYAQIQQLQGQIGATVGMQQSLQTVNQHLNLLAGQNAQLMSLIATAQANNSAQQQQAVLANGSAALTLQQRMQSEAQKIQQLHNQLRQDEAVQGWGVMGMAATTP